MGAGSSIQEYAEEVLAAATEGDAEKLSRVLASGDTIVETTEEATKELLLEELNTDNGGGLPLHVGCRDGNDGVVKALLEYGVAVDVANKFGDTPVHVACAKGHGKVVAILLQHAADLKAVDVQGRTPLFLAARGGYDEVVQELLTMKAKLGINAANKSGRTALMTAYMNGHMGVVKLLLDAGASLWVKDTNKKKILDLAFEKGDGEAAALFLAYDKDLKAVEVPATLTDEARLQVVAALAGHPAMQTLEMTGVPISEAVFKALVLMLRANSSIVDVKVDGPTLVESLQKLTDINFQLKQELDKELTTATMMMAVAIGKLKAAEILLQRPKEVRANPKAKYSSGESVHAIALRYASQRDGLVPILFYLHGVIDKDVGAHLSRPHQRAVVVRALITLENAGTPWRNQRTGGTVLHMLMDGFEAGYIEDSAFVQAAVELLNSCPHLMDIPNDVGKVISEVENLPKEWPFFNIKTLASKFVKKAMRRSLRFVRLMIPTKPAAAGVDEEDAVNLAHSFSRIITFCSDFDDVFSKWTAARPQVAANGAVVPGSVVMDGELVTGSLRCVHALSGLLDNAAENESEFLQHIDFLESELETATAENWAGQQKLEELENKVKEMEREKREAKRGFLDIGW